MQNDNSYRQLIRHTTNTLAKVYFPMQTNTAQRPIYYRVRIVSYTVRFVMKYTREKKFLAAASNIKAQWAKSVDQTPVADF